MTSQRSVYIATSLDRAADHNLVRDALAKLGIACSYDWTVHGSVAAQGADRLREVALLELGGVLRADLVIVLLPGGKGTHAELGAALAAGKQVLLHAQDPGDYAPFGRTCVFYHHPHVIPLDTTKGLRPWPELVAASALTLVGAEHRGLAVGQIRQDPDRRCQGRVVRIMALDVGYGVRYRDRIAEVQSFPSLKHALDPSLSGRKSMIRQDRLEKWVIA